jgi:hypothetical protein
MQNKDLRILPILVWCLLVACIGWFKWNFHELWKDEWQAWFVAKEMSISQLVNFTYYEAHPILWYLYLKFFSPLHHLIGDVSTINFAHLVSVAGGLYFLIVRFRLPLLIKVLFALTYFVSFEYAVVNRGYFLTIFLVFWAVDIIQRGISKPFHLGVILFLLCQTEVYGVFMALCLGLYLLQKEVNKLAFLGSTIGKWLIAGCIVFVISVFPRDQAHIAKAQSKQPDMAETVLIALQGNLSNTFTIGVTDDTARYGVNYLGVIISLFVVVGLYFLLKNEKKMLYSFASYLAMAIVFSSIFYIGGVRQWGMGFIFFIALLELRGLDLKLDWQPSAIVVIFCIFGMIHGMKAFHQDFKIPFTNAKTAGEYINTHVPIKVPVLSLNKFQTTPVIGYAGRNFFELPEGKEFNYFRWLDKIYLPTEREIKLFAKYKNVGGLVLISPDKIDLARFPGAQLWQSFDAPNFKDEKYYLYTIKAD